MLELITNVLLHEPAITGNFLIIANFILCIYFSFRSGIKGGLIVTALSLLGYTYFISTRSIPIITKEFAAIMVVFLSFVSFLIALIVGWCREMFDILLANQIEETQIAKQNQYRWERILEQLPVGIVVAKHPSGEIIERNKRALTLLGTIPRPVLSIADYNGFHAYSNNKKLKPYEWPIAQALLKKKTIMGKEIDLTNSDGKHMTLLFNAAPINDRNGKITAAVTTFNDITRLKELEKQKEELLIMASHELKTPLTSAKIFTHSLLTKLSDNSEAKKLTQKIDNQLDNLSSLISTILDMSQMEQGGLRVKEEPFILRDLALKTLTDLQSTTDHKITIDWQAKDYFYGNEERISQVFTNLMSNAIKFSPKESEIIVKCQKKGNAIIISIQDFGVGFTKDDEHHIFDKFFQSKQHKTYPGLGLGLYITAKIVKQYGGKIWAESENGKGSTFYFSLPIYKNTQYESRSKKI